MTLLRNSPNLSPAIVQTIDKTHITLLQNPHFVSAISPDDFDNIAFKTLEDMFNDALIRAKRDKGRFVPVAWAYLHGQHERVEGYLMIRENSILFTSKHPKDDQRLSSHVCWELSQFPDFIVNRGVLKVDFVDQPKEALPLLLCALKR